MGMRISCAAWPRNCWRAATRWSSTSRATAWSARNLVAEHGEGPLRRFQRRLSGAFEHALTTARWIWTARSTAPIWSSFTSGTTTTWCVASGDTARARAATGCCSTTPITAPSPTAQAMAAYDLRLLRRRAGLRRGAARHLPLRAAGPRRAWTWHEAADTRLFRSVDGQEREGDLVWIGNWGDDERTAELRRVPA